MDLDVLIPLIFTGLFLIIDVSMFIKMISLLKKSKDDTAENLGNKLHPYLYTTVIVSVLMGICMIVLTTMKYL